MKDLLSRIYIGAGAPKMAHVAALAVEADTLEGAPAKDTVHRVLTAPGVPPGQADAVAVACVLAGEAGWNAPDTIARVRALWVAAA